MADDKKLTTEQLADDKLDNVAGGTIDKAQIVRQSEYVKKIERTPRVCGQSMIKYASGEKNGI